MEKKDRLRIFRALHGLGQEELASLMGIDRAAIAKQEKGVYAPQWEALEKLGIEGWFEHGTRLPAQIFVPKMPGEEMRAQSVNAFRATISELVSLFFSGERIGSEDITIFDFEDGEVIVAGRHLICLFGPFRGACTTPLFDQAKRIDAKNFGNQLSTLSSALSNKAGIKSLLLQTNIRDGSSWNSFSKPKIDLILGNDAKRLTCKITIPLSDRIPADLDAKIKPKIEAILKDYGCESDVVVNVSWG